MGFIGCAKRDDKTDGSDNDCVVRNDGNARRDGAKGREVSIETAAKNFGGKTNGPCENSALFSPGASRLPTGSLTLRLAQERCDRVLKQRLFNKNGGLLAITFARRFGDDPLARFRN